MPKKAAELGPLQVSNLDKPGRHAVGGVAGLHLMINDKKARSWVLRSLVAGRRRDMGLGGYPDVTLAQARERARQARDQIYGGTDPIQVRTEARSQLIASKAAAKTFNECVTGLIEARSFEWKNAKHKQQWQNTLAMHAGPVIGELLVKDVGLAQVLKVLEPIWHNTTETATRGRGRIESVLDWATVRGYRTGENPARWKGHLDQLLAKPNKITTVKHHNAVPVDGIANFLVDLRKMVGMGARALEFAIYTAARSGEVRGTLWSEINMDTALWIAPAERMKAKRQHRIPLSEKALAVLTALPRIDGVDVMFPGSTGQVLSDMTLSAVMRRMQVEAVPHGFRSTFRDWASERTNFPRELAEMALAHTIESKVEAAYRRGDLLVKRLQMMQAWADFCERPVFTGNAMPHRRTE
jgi:integrase